MRRYPIAIVFAAGLAVTLAAVPSSGASRGSGPLGFTTVAMSPGPSYGEPSLSWAPDGRHAIICTPGGDANRKGTVQYWYTANAGKTWAHSESTGPKGGGDCTVDFMPDGTAISADLEVTDSYLQRSTDWGKTWQPIGAAGQQQDRQWLAHSNNGGTEYLVYHDFAAEAEWFATGTYDKKTKTFTFPKQDCCNTAQSVDQASAPGIAGTQATGGSASLIDEGGNSFSGPILVDPSDQSGKRLYVIYSISDAQSNLNPQDGVPPYGPTRGVVVATSDNAGLTWTSHYAAAAPPNPDGSKESSMGAIFPWGSIDAAGNLYVVYNSTIGTTGHFHQYYVFSKDHGTTWSKPVKLDRLGLNTGSAIYATSDAGAPGQLAVAWYQTDNGTPSSTSMQTTWTPHIAEITQATSGHPRIVEQPVTGIPNHRGGICLQGILCGVGPGSPDRSLLDFFQVKLNPVTGLAAIAYSDNGGFRHNEGKGVVVFAIQTRHALKPASRRR